MKDCTLESHGIESKNLRAGWRQYWQLHARRYNPGCGSVLLHLCLSRRGAVSGQILEQTTAANQLWFVDYIDFTSLIQLWYPINLVNGKWTAWAALYRLRDVNFTAYEIPYRWTVTLVRVYQIYFLKICRLKTKDDKLYKMQHKRANYGYRYGNQQSDKKLSL